MGSPVNPLVTLLNVPTGLLTILHKFRIGKAVEADAKTSWILSPGLFVAIDVLIDKVLAAIFGDVGVHGLLLWCC